MRIFEKEKRLQHSYATIDYFMSNEYNYYSNNNIREFEFDGELHKSLYRRLNVQLMITKKCPFNCSFCIEKINPVGDENVNFDLQISNLKRLLETLLANGMAPTVSITGGEPTLFAYHVKDVKEMLDKMGVPYNLNTAGVINKANKKLVPSFSRVNLSVHNHDVDKNSEIFGSSRGDYWNSEMYQHATIQSVILSADIDYLKEFLDSFDNKRFSIRLPAETEDTPSIEWKEMFDKIEKDSDFEFVQQKIGDYYWYEEWKYKGKVIRFSFASMKQLAYYKERYAENERMFTRAAIIMPDGNVRFDWITE